MSGRAPCNESWDAPVVVRDLGYEVDGHCILEGISFEVGGGEILGIMGMSGSGKTTILKNVMGLLRPTRGDIIIEGRSLRGLGERELAQIRRKMGMCFQYSALFDSLSVGENVAFPLRQHTRLKEAEIRRAVADKLETVGMSGTEEAMPGDLSGGERKRVSIARALALEPSIMLYDEPSAGLDPIMAGVIDRLIEKLSHELCVTSIIVSHHVHNVLGISDQVVMVHEGRMAAKGTPEELMESDAEIVRQFIEGSATGPIRV
ncbi:MAG: ABC transporter ATP-binding protein [Armatimonadota bacterium]